MARHAGRRAGFCVPAALGVACCVVLCATSPARGVGAVSATGPASGHAMPPAAPAGLLHEVLPNGLTVTIVPVPENPVVATQIWYHVGAANEDPHTRGFAHLFEHLMFGGTSQNDRRAYAEAHRRHGGYENAFTSWDETVYISTIPPEGHDRVLELEADRMVNLVLDEQNLANEKRIVTEELRLRIENDPMARLGTTVLKEVLGDHPYAITPAGTKEDIAAATLPHARDFYARYYRPRNAHLVIVGPVDPAAKMARVRELFGPLPADGVTPPDVPPLVGRPFPAEVDVEEDLPPVEVAALIFALPPADAPDHVALAVMREMLTGGALDPFREELVTARRKAVEAGIEALELRRGTAMIFYSAALPYRRKATAFRYAGETLAQLGRGAWLTDDALAAAKRRLLRAEWRRAYYADAQADAVGRARWWQGDAGVAFDTAARVEKITRDDVRRVFDTYVATATPVRVYLRPERVPLLVRLFGWLYPLVD